MGNRLNRVFAANHRPVKPLEERSRSEKAHLVVSTTTNYSTIDGEAAPRISTTGPPQHSIQQTSVGRSPVQACEDGKPEQNKLLLPRAELPYDKTVENDGTPPKQRILCRTLSGILVFLLLISFAILLVIVLLHPSGYSKVSTVQGSTITLLDDTNPFWFESAIISRVDKTVLYDVYVGWIDCENLHTIHTEIRSDVYWSHKATRDYYQQLGELEPYAYLVAGSKIELDINITSSPSSQGKNVSLLIYNDFNEYNKLISPGGATARYSQSFLLNSTRGQLNRIAINVTDTSFYFFGVHTPNGTGFTYNFTVHQVSYNDSNLYLPCYLPPGSVSCKLDLNVTRCVSCSKQCLMSYCEANSEAPQPFYPLKIDIKRRRFNWISITLMVAVVSFGMIFIAIGIYDVVKFKICPVGNRVLMSMLRRHR